MSGRAPSDLVRQMRLLIAEEAYLWELTERVTDYYGSERRITHGPWRPADIQQIVVRWFDDRMIDCIAISWATRVRSTEVVHYEYDADWRTRATEHGQYLVLARDDAGALLNDLSAWRMDGDGASVMLCESDLAAGLSFDAWFGRLEGLPDYLIYEQPLDGVADGKATQTLPEPEEVLSSRLWMQALEHAATDGLPLLCPVNRDAHLAFDWDPASGETPASQSLDDIFYFVDQGEVERRQPFPFGRHRLRCPGCGAERYLIVMRKPG